MSTPFSLCINKKVGYGRYYCKPLAHIPASHFPCLALPWQATQSSQQFPSALQKSEQDAADPHVMRSLGPWCRKYSGNTHHLQNLLLGNQIQILVGAIEFKYCTWYFDQKLGHLHQEWGEGPSINYNKSDLFKIWPGCLQFWPLRLSGTQMTPQSHMDCL